MLSLKEIIPLLYVSRILTVSTYKCSLLICDHSFYCIVHKRPYKRRTYIIINLCIPSHENILIVIYRLNKRYFKNIYKRHSFSSGLKTLITNIDLENNRFVRHLKRNSRLCNMFIMIASSQRSKLRVEPTANVLN